MRIDPEREPGAGQPEDEPRQGDHVELVAEQRHALAEPDEPEVARRERCEQRQRGRPVASGRGDGVELGHSIEIRTPSPSSSTSTMGPLMPAAIASRIRSEVASEMPGDLGDGGAAEGQRDAQVDDRPAAPR